MTYTPTTPQVSHSAVVLGATKCFIRLTTGNPELQRAVFTRLRTPLLTLTASASNELAYAVLSHVRLIVDRAPGIFDDEFKQVGSASNPVRSGSAPPRPFPRSSSPSSTSRRV